MIHMFLSNSPSLGDINSSLPCYSCFDMTNGARDLIFFTTDLQTVIYYSKFTAVADLFLNKTIVDLCFGRHGVLLNGKLNYIDLCSVSVNLTLTVQ